MFCVFRLLKTRKTKPPIAGTGYVLLMTRSPAALKTVQNANDLILETDWPFSEILEDARLDLFQLLRQFGPDFLLHILILQQCRAPR